MAPKKRGGARQAQLQPIPPQSDYDTDTAALTDNQYQFDMAVHAQPRRSAEELNMLVLRRWYPDIESILAIAPFATLYLFAPDSQQWTKCETEGVLFVVQLVPENGYPRYRVVILNRKSMENFVLDLVTMDNIEITSEYVIVQVPDEEGAPQIFGIWIFSDKATVPDTRDVIASTIVHCATKAEEYAQHAAELVGFNNVTAPEVSYGNPREPSWEDQQTPIAQQAQSQGLTQNAYGQQIDLNKLFGKPQPSAFQPAAEYNAHANPLFNAQISSLNVAAPSHAHPAHFSANADTDFFRQPQSVAPVHQQTPQQQQNSALLDLFKNASKLS